MSREVLQQALEALEGVLDDSPKVLGASISGGLYEVIQCRDAITAIKEALAQREQPEQEREWVGLTDEEISEVLGSDIHAEQSGELRFIRAIEAKLRERNS